MKLKEILGIAGAATLLMGTARVGYTAGTIKGSVVAAKELLKGNDLAIAKIEFEAAQSEVIDACLDAVGSSKVYEKVRNYTP